MKTSQIIDNITGVGLYALRMTYTDVYSEIIRFMMKENPMMRDDLREMIGELTGEYHFEEFHTPQDLSIKYLGHNIFTFNTFQYYLMAYHLIQSDLAVIFTLLNEQLEQPIANEIMDCEKDVLKVFDYGSYTRFHVSGEVSGYQSSDFQQFLAERQQWREHFLKLVVEIRQLVDRRKAR